MKTIFIGVDPGSNTGVAIWNKPERKLTLKQFSCHCVAMFWLHEYLRSFNTKDVKFRIEDARMAKKRPDLAQINKGKLQGVGYVKAYSKDWQGFCVYHGYDHEMLMPRNTKVNPDYFEKLTGQKTVKTASHIRDAGMLVYGI